MKKNEQRLRDLWDTMQHTNMEEERKGKKNI